MIIDAFIEWHKRGLSPLLFIGYPLVLLLINLLNDNELSQYSVILWV